MNGTEDLLEHVTYVSVYESVPFVHAHVTLLDARSLVESTTIADTMIKDQS